MRLNIWWCLCAPAKWFHNNCCLSRTQFHKGKPNKETQIKLCMVAYCGWGKNSRLKGNCKERGNKCITILSYHLTIVPMGIRASLGWHNVLNVYYANDSQKMHNITSTHSSKLYMNHPLAVTLILKASKCFALLMA